MYYKYNYSLLFSSFWLLLTSLVPAQAGDISPTESKKINTYIVAQNNTDQYNSNNGNPLLFPTKPKEVEIENVDSITLLEAVEIAFQNNEDLKEARLELDNAQEGLNAELATQLPTLDTNVEFNQRADDTSNSFLGGGGFIARDRTVIQGQIELGYNVYDGGNRSARIERARRQVFFNQLGVEVIAEQLRFDVSDAYYELQNADAQVAIAQAAIEDFSQTLRDARLLEQAGLGTRFDVLQAEVDLATANQGLTTAIAAQKNARRALAEVLNVGEQIELAAADEIKENGTWEYSLDESIVMAYKNRAELEQLLVQREINAQNVEIRLSDIRPRLDLFANYNFTNTFNDTFNNTGYAQGYNTGVRINWQLFDGGEARARAEQEKINIEIDENNFSDQKNQIRLAVESSYNDLIANKENIGTTETAVVTAVENLRLARLRFQAGVGTQTDVINAQRSLTEARGNFLQAIIGYNQSLNNLQRAVSNLPDNKIAEFR